MAATLPLWRRPPIPFCALLCAIFGFAVFFELGRMDVVSDNEGQRAAPAAEMLATGHYVVPTINGNAYLAKPPLLYWAIVPVYRLTGGPSEWAARLPSACCAVALVLCVYLMLRGPAGERHARWAALMTGIAPYVLERARWTELDIPLTFAMFLAIAMLHLGRGRVRPILLGGIATGAAMMLKGPVVFPFLWAGWVATAMARNPESREVARGVQWTIGALILDFALRGIAGLLDVGGLLAFPWGLFLLLAVWTWFATRADWRGERLFVRWTLGALVGVLCVLPWAAAVLREIPWADVRALLSEQVVERTHTASQINSGTSFYFFLGAPLMLAPWGLLLPGLLSRSLWDTSGAWYRFAVLFSGVSVAAFSLFAGKEYEYILPAVPFMASALAYVWLHEGDYGEWGLLNVWVRFCKAALPPVLAVFVVLVAIYSSIANPNSLLLAEIWLVVGVSYVVLRFVWRMEGPARLAVAAYAVIFIALVARSFYYTGDRSPKAIAELAASLERRGYTVETSKVYPAIAFYSGGRIPALQDIDRVSANLRGETPYFYLTRSEILEAYLRDVPPEDRQVLAGPFTSKHHVLIGNAALPEAL